jgi:hypothetical protein
MILLLGGEREIEDARDHGFEVVSKLRTAVARGVQATPDPRRPGVYDVYDNGRVFFIYVSPVNGNVTLIATWLENSGERKTASACAVAAA